MIKLNKFIINYFVIFLILFLLPIFLKNYPFIESIFFLAIIYAVLASAWNILGGYVGPFSIGHSIFFGIGAYSVTIFYVRFGLSPWVGMLLSILVVLIFTLTIGQLILRLQMHFFALSTIAILILFKNVASHWVDLTGGVVGIGIPFNVGIQNITFSTNLPYIYIALIFLSITLLGIYKIMNSKTGFYFLAIREDENVASALGINVHLYKTIALSISAVITALGGIIFVMQSGHITPMLAFSLDRATDIVIFSVIGGMGTLFGPLLGTFILLPLTQYLRFLFGGKVIGLHYIIYGIVLIFIILKIPKGLITIGLPNIRKKTNLHKKINGSKVIRSTRTANNLINSANNSIAGTAENIEDSIILEAKDLTKSFKGLEALKDVSFKIKRGEIFGLIGPNGAGKTTLFNLINGFLKPDYGKVVFCGHNITGNRPYQIYKKSIGRTFQKITPLKGLTTLENIMIGAFINCKSTEQATDKALKIIDFVDLEEKKNQLASILTIFEQKKLELGRAIAGEPKLMMIDEIMAGLNPNETNIMFDLLKQIANNGVTLFLIEHKMEVIMNIADRILVIDHGKQIFSGTPKEVSRNKSTIDAYLGKRSFKS